MNDLTLAHSLERHNFNAHCLGALAGLGPPVFIVSRAAPVFSGMSSSAWAPATLLGVFQMKMAPSVPAVTMNFWFGEMAICLGVTQNDVLVRVSINQSKYM